MKQLFSFAFFSLAATTLNSGCSVEPTDASIQADNKTAANAGKVLVEKAPCDVDIFISTEQSRCVEYRAGTCHDYIYKGNKIEDRGEFACTFSLISGNAEKKDRTRIKLTGGTLNYDLNFKNGFQDSVCSAKTSSDMQVGNGRWVFWRPDQQTCASWAGKISKTDVAAPSKQTTLPDANEDAPIPDQVDLSNQDASVQNQPAIPATTTNQNSGGGSGTGGSSGGGSGSGSSNSTNSNSSIFGSVLGFLGGLITGS